MAIQPEDLIQALVQDGRVNGLEDNLEFFPDMTYLDAAYVSMRKSLVSKWSQGMTKETKQAALEKFLHSNQLCKDWSLPKDQFGEIQIDSKTEMLLNKFKLLIQDFWCISGGPGIGPQPLVDDPRDILERARIGPGANVSANGGDFYTKFFSSPLTCTSAYLSRWYNRYISTFPDWERAEDVRCYSYGGAKIVEGSKLSFVPKNDKISRCICTEPTLNTYYQLGFAAHLEQRLLSRFGIDLQQQQFKNRDLARLGSLTDNLVTLDLSSASDSISLSMIRQFFPADFVRWLELLRCERTEIPGRGTVELHMISSMGNGYTFPLETIIFSCVVQACLDWRGIPSGKSKDGNCWGVFGDDIICPSACADDVISLLGLLGFRLNLDKSFVQGPFRESCGSDFYLGAPIRGIYLKRLDTYHSRYSAINQLIRFETQTGLSLENVIKLLLKETPKQLFVPRWANIDSGIQVPRSNRRHILKDRRSQCDVFYAIEPRPPKMRVCDSLLVVPRSYKRRIFNPHGLWISFLQGSVNGHMIGVRSKDDVPYVRKRRLSHNWDSPLSQHWDRRGQMTRDLPDYELDWRRWESVVDYYFPRG